MRAHHQPSGITQGLELLINPNWSPEQAMAVLELLDDLRDLIWARYEIVLHEQYRNDRVTEFDIDESDPPF